MTPDLTFTIRQLRGFLGVLLRSRLAVAGIIILALYSFVAIAAPILSPYLPSGAPVAGGLVPPSWYKYVGQGTSLSENMVLEEKTGWTTDPSSGGWQFASQSQNVKYSFNSTYTYFTPGSGSAQITLDRTTPVQGRFTATFKKPFNWPYKGPPDSFTGTVSVSTPTASSTEPVEAVVFIERLSTQTYFYLTDNSTASTPRQLSWESYPLSSPLPVWKSPIREIDSRNMVDILRMGTGDPAVLIFSSPGDYAYGVSVTFTSATTSSQPLQVFLDNLNMKMAGSSWGLLGTDNAGNDIATQLMYGTRVSLEVGLVAASIGIVVGLVVGLAAGYMGKLVDEVLMRFTDMLLVIPTLPLIIVLVATLGGTGTLPVLIAVIGFLGWMGFARVARAQVLSLKERPFVEAAKAAGAGTRQIMVRHIVPNIVGLIYVNLALAVPGAILSEAALSFLGLGDPSVLSWGRMLNLVEITGAQHAWWWVLPPGISIALVSLSFVMIGFSLDAIFNPKLRQRR